MLQHNSIIITTLLRLIVYNYISMGPGRKHKLDGEDVLEIGERYALLMRAN